MYTKYPRTMHLPWSLGITDDDKVLKDNPLYGKIVVVTEKMDGENTTLYNDHIHARSLDSRHHPSRDWVKQFWSTFRHEIPDGMRICGENLFAKHSIYYEDLPSYFMGFSVWIGDECLSWDDTLEWFELFGITPVPVIWEGYLCQGTIETIEDVWHEMKQTGEHEGYVIRLCDSFKMDDFGTSVAKFVRKNHVQTDTHWMNGPVIPNGLKQ